MDLVVHRTRHQTYVSFMHSNGYFHILWVSTTKPNSLYDDLRIHVLCNHLAIMRNFDIVNDSYHLQQSISARKILIIIWDTNFKGPMTEPCWLAHSRSRSVIHCYWLWKGSMYPNERALTIFVCMYRLFIVFPSPL